jgi:hypothetical protein
LVAHLIQLLSSTHYLVVRLTSQNLLSLLCTHWVLRMKTWLVSKMILIHRQRLIYILPLPISTSLKITRRPSTIHRLARRYITLHLLVQLHWLLYLLHLLLVLLWLSSQSICLFSFLLLYINRDTFLYIAF